MGGAGEDSVAAEGRVQLTCLGHSHDGRCCDGQTYDRPAQTGCCAIDGRWACDKSIHFTPPIRRTPAAFGLRIRALPGCGKFYMIANGELSICCKRFVTRLVTNWSVCGS